MQGVVAGIGPWLKDFHLQAELVHMDMGPGRLEALCTHAAQLPAPTSGSLLRRVSTLETPCPSWHGNVQGATGWAAPRARTCRACAGAGATGGRAWPPRLPAAQTPPRRCCRTAPAAQCPAPRGPHLRGRHTIGGIKEGRGEGGGGTHCAGDSPGLLAGGTGGLFPPPTPQPPTLTTPPVRVAASTSSSGASLTASASASHRMRRPSASVLPFSTVIPARVRSTSSGLRGGAGPGAVGTDGWLCGQASRQPWRAPSGSRLQLL